MKKKNIKILAIETSCDETAAAVVEVAEGYKKLRGVTKSYSKKQPIVTYHNLSQPSVTILSNAVSSQVKLHAQYGGVYPELASREHIRNILDVVAKSCEGLRKVAKGCPRPMVTNSNHRQLLLTIGNHIDAIAVTTGPGLIGSLLVGVNTAKTLAYIYQRPIYPINHLEAHIYSNFADPSNLAMKQFSNEAIFPVLALVVSGGHTALVYMPKHLTYKVVGETLDDAAGEAFDKVAAMLGLGYPGGPVIAEVAKGCEKLQQVTNGYKKFATVSNYSQPSVTIRNRIHFPRPMLDSDNFDFSFSGLKTAVLYTIKKLPKPLSQIHKRLVCQEFQDAVIDTLVTKTMRAAKKYQVKSILLSGGVAANSHLRQEFKLKIKNLKLKIGFSVPPKNLCTDNAAMVGATAAYKIALGKKPTPWYDVHADANVELT